jgi:hypothetical protein
MEREHSWTIIQSQERSPSLITITRTSLQIITILGGNGMRIWKEV